MKKIFAFAIAAATMAVGCQKIQSLVNPDYNEPIEETDLVEIQFSSNIATVETKSAVTDLAGLTVKVYGINNDDETSKRQFYNLDATAESDDGGITLNLGSTKQYYDGTTETYSFYGYYLDGATTEGTLDSRTPSAKLTITGEEDVLLAAAEGNGSFCGNTAKNDTKPHLQFNHALSQFQFAAKNLGTKEITLEAIKIKTALTGTMDVIASTVTANSAADGEEINVSMTSTSLSSSTADAEFNDVPATEVMVMPGSTYVFEFTVTQDGQSRTLQVTANNEIAAGTAYKFQISLYSLEEIELTASLTPWDEVQILDLDTNDAVELEE